MLKKKSVIAFGKRVFLLGVDSNKDAYWLESATWDCDWYWGGGYVETYTNNWRPDKSTDIKSHSHFDSMFFRVKNKHGFDAFKSFFVDTPFSDSEIWEICELMKSFYIAREYSDMLYEGGAHYTSNPAKTAIQSKNEYNRINNKVIPTIMHELYKILGGLSYE